MLRLLAALVLLLAAPVVSAQQPDFGFFAGGRVGLAIPFGAMTETTGGTTLKVRDQFPYAIPLIFEGGVRVSGVAVGLYYQHGFAAIGDDALASLFGESPCDQPGIKCESGRVRRFGVELILPLARTDSGARPWIGGGIGREWAGMELKDTEAGMGIDFTFKGWEVFGQGGVEWQLSPNFVAGPYASLSLARYSDLDIELFGSGEIIRKRWHEWIQVGVAGRFEL